MTRGIILIFFVVEPDLMKQAQEKRHCVKITSQITPKSMTGIILLTTLQYHKYDTK